MIVCQKGGNISKEYKLPPKKTIGVINNVGIIDICSKLELINPIKKPNNLVNKESKLKPVKAISQSKVKALPQSQLRLPASRQSLASQGLRTIDCLVQNLK